MEDTRINELLARNREQNGTKKLGMNRGRNYGKSWECNGKELRRNCKENSEVNSMELMKMLRNLWKKLERYIYGRKREPRKKETGVGKAIYGCNWELMKILRSLWKKFWRGMYCNIYPELFYVSKIEHYSASLPKSSKKTKEKVLYS